MAWPAIWSISDKSRLPNITRPSFCGEKSKNMRIQTKNNSQKIVKYLKLPAKTWAGAQIYYSLTFI